MLPFFDPLRDMTINAIMVRMVLACVCGGVIGIEREFKRRPAGFRTHILICLGAATTTLTSQYLGIAMHYQTDLARLGAQVVSGVGFIGAGTIIVSRHQRVKGLTTAAGLWASAIVGLSIGAGFYEGGIATAILIVIAELLFSKIEFMVFQKTPEVNLFLQYIDKSCLNQIIKEYQEKHIKILKLEITRQSADAHYGAIITLRLPKTCTIERLVEDVRNFEGLISIEAL